MKAIWLLFALTLFLQLPLTSSLFCEENNCYDLLQVSRDDALETIKKSYRNLSKLYHPDKNPNNPRAHEIFLKIANAYEILKDDEMRKEYDWLLDHPDTNKYVQQARYYRAKIQSKINVRWVLIFVLFVISLTQAVSQRVSYNYYFRAVKRTQRLMTEVKKIEKELMDKPPKQDKEKDKENEREKKEGSGGKLSEKKKEKLREKEREGQREIQKQQREDEAVKLLMLREGISQVPDYKDILAVQLVILPYTLPRYSWRWIRIWKCYLKGEEYSGPDQEYLIARRLGFSQRRWDGLDPTKKAQLLEWKLWIQENFIQYIQSSKEQIHEQYMEKAWYKRYRRFVKKYL